mgnify:CR=1 FL=1
MKKTNYEILGKEDALNLIGKQWMLVTAGTSEKFNMMTASWGCLGWLWNKPVAFVFIRPERFTHGFIEASDCMTLSFYGEEYREALKICGTKSGRDTDKVAATGLTPVELESGNMTFGEARLTLDSRKLFKTSMQEANFIDKELLEKWYGAHGGLHDVYVVEIENVYINE